MRSRRSRRTRVSGKFLSCPLLLCTFHCPPVLSLSLYLSPSFFPSPSSGSSSVIETVIRQCYIACLSQFPQSLVYIHFSFTILSIFLSAWYIPLERFVVCDGFRCGHGAAACQLTQFDIAAVSLWARLEFALLLPPYAIAQCQLNLVSGFKNRLSNPT